MFFQAFNRKYAFLKQFIQLPGCRRLGFRIPLVTQAGSECRNLSSLIQKSYGIQVERKIHKRGNKNYCNRHDKTGLQSHIPIFFPISFCHIISPFLRILQLSTPIPAHNSIIHTKTTAVQRNGAKGICVFRLPFLLIINTAARKKVSRHAPITSAVHLCH